MDLGLSSPEMNSAPGVPGFTHANFANFHLTDSLVTFHCLTLVTGLKYDSLFPPSLLSNWKLNRALNWTYLTNTGWCSPSPFLSIFFCLSLGKHKKHFLYGSTGPLQFPVCSWKNSFPCLLVDIYSKFLTSVAGFTAHKVKTDLLS